MVPVTIANIESLDVGLTCNGASAYAYTTEISSQRLRTYTAGFSMGIVAPVGITMGVLVPYMINTNQWNWGLKTAWFFTGVGLPFTAAMWFLIPETAGYVRNVLFFWWVYCV